MSPWAATSPPIFFDKLRKFWKGPAMIASNSDTLAESWPSDTLAALPVVPPSRAPTIAPRPPTALAGLERKDEISLRISEAAPAPPDVDSSLVATASSLE